MTSHNLNTNYSDVLYTAKLRFRDDADRVLAVISVWHSLHLKSAQFLLTGLKTQMMNV